MTLMITRFLTALNIFDWPAHQVDLPTIFYHQALQPLQDKQLFLNNVQQAKLAMAYQVPAYFYQDNYPAWLVTNALFGGDSDVDVILACAVNKSIWLIMLIVHWIRFVVFLLVQSGIDQRDYEKVVTTIQAQVANLAAGKF